MNSKLSAFIGFILGTGAGFGGCYIYLKKKNEKKLAEEVESIKSTYEKLNNADNNGSDDSKKVGPQDAIDEHYTEAVKAFKEYSSGEAPDNESEEEDSDSDDEGDSYDYSGYGDDYKDEDFEESEYEKFVKSFDADDPVILITEPEYADMGIGYDKREVSYYADPDEPHAIDIDTGHEMDDWASTLGLELGLLDDELFEEYSGIVYIRNNYLSTDYLVSKASSAFV